MIIDANWKNIYPLGGIGQPLPLFLLLCIQEPLKNPQIVTLVCTPYDC